MYKGEDQDSEFKLLLPKETKKWLKTFVGFLNNGRGGKIVFGVNDDGQAEGLEFFSKKTPLEERLNIDNIHYCNFDTAKCLDLLMIYMSNIIRNEVRPWVSTTNFSLKIISREPAIVRLNVRPTREIVYSIAEANYPNETGVYVREGAQTLQLNHHQVKALKQIRKKQINYSYLTSPQQELSFHELHETFALEKDYSAFLNHIRDKYQLFIPKTKTWNYEAFLLSDQCTADLTINLFDETFSTSHLPDKYIWERIPLPLMFVQIKLFLRSCFVEIEVDKLNEILFNVITHNDYYNFSLSGPLVEITKRQIIFASFEKDNSKDLIKYKRLKYPNIRRFMIDNLNFKYIRLSRFIDSTPELQMLSDQITVKYIWRRQNNLHFER